MSKDDDIWDRPTGPIGFIVAAVIVMFACVFIWNGVTNAKPEATVTYQERCAEEIATYMSLEQCHYEPNCRLYDKEYNTYRKNKIASVKSCALARIEIENKIEEEMKKNDD